MTKEVAEEVARRLSKNSMLKSLYDADYSDYRERIESRAAEAVDKRQGRDNHYGNHDPELSPDCQSEDQNPWATRSSSINELADKGSFARGINKLRAAAAKTRTPCFSPWEDSGRRTGPPIDFKEIESIHKEWERYDLDGRYKVTPNDPKGPKL